MRMRTMGPFRRGVCVLAVCGAALAAATARAQGVVPGTGVRLTEVGDDFEDPDWNWIPNLPKSSSNLDKQERRPLGMSANARWQESGYRGQPDVVRRVPTPPGGLPGSTGALLMRSLQTGVPGSPSRQMQQDDLLLRVTPVLGRTISVAESPNFVVRVYLPPFDEWEPRTGSTFGVRADLQTTLTSTKRGLLSRRQVKESEPYWPGMFIQFHSRHDPRHDRDSAVIVVRAGDRGQDLLGPEIREAGWWTMGMSITPDGQVHYYARPGVEDLTAADHIVSTFPYGYRAEKFGTFFFNIVNQDDGRTWSTEWIIDDAALFVLRR